MRYQRKKSRAQVQSKLGCQQTWQEMDELVKCLFFFISTLYYFLFGFLFAIFKCFYNELTNDFTSLLFQLVVCYSESLLVNGQLCKLDKNICTNQKLASD